MKIKTSELTNSKIPQKQMMAAKDSHHCRL